jgi:hypothetical protein
MASPNCSPSVDGQFGPLVQCRSAFDFTLLFVSYPKHNAKQHVSDQGTASLTTRPGRELSVHHPLGFAAAASTSTHSLSRSATSHYQREALSVVQARKFETSSPIVLNSSF